MKETVLCCTYILPQYIHQDDLSYTLETGNPHPHSLNRSCQGSCLVCRTWGWSSTLGCCQQHGRGKVHGTLHSGLEVYTQKWHVLFLLTFHLTKQATCPHLTSGGWGSAVLHAPRGELAACGGKNHLNIISAGKTLLPMRTNTAAGHLSNGREIEKADWVGR